MNDESTTEHHDEQGEPQVQLRIVGFDETAPQYANDVHVSSDAMGLQLVFTRFLPPPVVTESDQQRLAELGYVPNEVVARVIVPRLLVERLLRILPERLAQQRLIQDDYSEWLQKGAADVTDDVG